MNKMKDAEGETTSDYRLTERMAGKSEGRKTVGSYGEDGRLTDGGGGERDDFEAATDLRRAHRQGTGMGDTSVSIKTGKLSLLISDLAAAGVNQCGNAQADGGRNAPRWRGARGGDGEERRRTLFALRFSAGSSDDAASTRRCDSSKPIRPSISTGSLRPRAPASIGIYIEKGKGARRTREHEQRAKADLRQNSGGHSSGCVCVETRRGEQRRGEREAREEEQRGRSRAHSMTETVGKYVWRCLSAGLLSCMTLRQLGMAPASAFASALHGKSELAIHVRFSLDSEFDCDPILSRVSIKNRLLANLPLDFGEVVSQISPEDFCVWAWRDDKRGMRMCSQIDTAAEKLGIVTIQTYSRDMLVLVQEGIDVESLVNRRHNRGGQSLR
ncbi:hypothetical protein B0H10DRAFT_1974474 [Mycena sp. CBHHK59/15]|nr:hypothetical protein B0H10DRAFT_1974474 [Mycena sp. CBHHK59/15]